MIQTERTFLPSKIVHFLPFFSVDTLNAAARQLLKDGGDSEAAGKIDEMNQKWRQLNNDIEEIGRRMDKVL